MVASLPFVLKKYIVVYFNVEQLERWEFTVWWESSLSGPNIRELYSRLRSLKQKASLCIALSKVKGTLTLQVRERELGK